MKAALPARTRPLPTAFVINLDRDTVRLTHMEAECARVGIPMQRWPAMLGAALPPALASSFVTPSSGGAWSLSSGEIGCYASHITIWQALVDGALVYKVFGDVALVMEDDLRLEDDFVPAVQRALAVAPSGWDLIRLSNAPRRAFVPVAEISPRYRLVHYTRVPCSCGAYLISRSGAKKLLALRARTLPVDEDCRRGWRFGLKTFGVLPLPATPGIFESTITKLGGRECRPRGWNYVVPAIADRLGSVRTNWAALGWRGWLLSQGVNIADTVLRKTPFGSILEKAAPMLTWTQRSRCARRIRPAKGAARRPH
jgi:glycosyl transferase, family 25